MFRFPQDSIRYHLGYISDLDETLEDIQGYISEIADNTIVWSKRKGNAYFVQNEYQ